MIGFFDTPIRDDHRVHPHRACACEGAVESASKTKALKTDGLIVAFREDKKCRASAPSSIACYCAAKKSSAFSSVPAGFQPFDELLDTDGR